MLNTSVPQRAFSAAFKLPTLLFPRLLQAHTFFFRFSFCISGSSSIISRVSAASSADCEGWQLLVVVLKPSSAVLSSWTMSVSPVALVTCVSASHASSSSPDLSSELWIHVISACSTPFVGFRESSSNTPSSKLNCYLSSVILGQKSESHSFFFFSFINLLAFLLRCM